MGISPTRDKTLAKPVCRHFIREKPEFNALLCGKLDQWLSSKYCYFCRFYEKIYYHQQKPSFDNYNYNYYITHQRGGTEEQSSNPTQEFIINPLEEEASH